MPTIDCPRCEKVLEGYSDWESDDRDRWIVYHFIQDDFITWGCKCNHTPSEEKEMETRVKEAEEGRDIDGEGWDF